MSFINQIRPMIVCIAVTEYKIPPHFPNGQKKQ